jgi:hypothetical protein
MRALALGLVFIALGVALPARADTVRTSGKRTITIHTDPIVVYRGLRADGTMIARTPIPASLAKTPPPRCKRDRRGDLHCVITY